MCVFDGRSRVPVWVTVCLLLTWLYCCVSGGGGAVSLFLYGIVSLCDCVPL